MKALVAIAVCLFFLVVLNLFAQSLLANSTAYNEEQKHSQRLLIWMLPFFGALFVIGFIQGDKVDRKKPADIGDINRMTVDDAITLRDTINNASHRDD